MDYSILNQRITKQIRSVYIYIFNIITEHKRKAQLITC